jgi:TolB-like protein/Tfp pilus assembly protein PilF
MKNFLKELKRRNVIKASISYLVVAWLILQISSIISPIFHLSESLQKWNLIFLLIGFPVWVIFAYIYEITPTGLKKTDDVDSGESIRTSTNKKLNAYIIAGLSLVVILLVFDRFYQIDVSLDDDFVPNSIAILPFENVSESEDAYFAAGITEDILTQISKIGEIRVLSSLSMRDYDMTGKSPEEIGEELGVSHILIGNVRRSEGNLRIGCQLVDTASEGTIWAETYDKKMSNVFAMQTEIAFEIANSLDATISEKEEAIIEKKPTDNMAALDLVYRGRELTDKSGKNYNEQALILFKEAIVLDPYFSTAYSELSITYSLGYQDYGNYSRDYLDTALLLAQKAIDLGPDFSVNWHALGMAYSLKGKIEQAIAMYQKVLELNPNASGAYNNLAIYYMERGNPVEAIQMFKKAIGLYPVNSIKSSTAYSNLSWCYRTLGLGEQAFAAAEKSVELEDTNLGRVNLASSNYMVGDSLGMINNLDAMLKLDPESSSNLFFMTLFYFEFIDLEKGKSYLERLKSAENFDIRDFPNTVNYDAYLAFKAGNTDQAKALLSKNLDFYLSEIQAGIQFQSYLWGIATIYAIQDDQEKAVIWLNKLVESGSLNVVGIRDSRLFDNLFENEDYLNLLDKLQVKVDSLREVIIREEMNSNLRSFE